MDQTLKGKPLISVILPVYNGGSFLKEAVSSILAQTLIDFEFIIIDDGSTDESAVILRDFANQDTRIRLIQRANKGLVYSLNEGLCLARGKYIARMDSDDRAYPGRFKAQVDLLEQESADICGCHFKLVSAKNKLLATFIAPVSTEAIDCTLLIVPPFAHGAVMFRADFLKLHKLQYTSVAAEDHLLWCEFWIKGAKFVTVDEFLFDYRVHAASISNVKTKLLKADVRNNAKRLLQCKQQKIKESIESLSLQELSEFEEQMLLLAAFKYSKMHADLLFFRSLRRVRKKSLLLVLFKIFSAAV